jgi:TM2 domain-containing membrane protein YozV
MNNQFEKAPANTQARTQMASTWVTDLPLPVVQQRIQTFILQNSMKQVSEQPGEPTVYVLEQGSQITTRALGALFVDPVQLPKRAIIQLKGAADGTSVEASIGESLGIGLFDPGTQSRYEDYFRRWIGLLMTALPPAAGSEVTNPQAASPDGQIQAYSTAPAPQARIFRSAKSRGTALLLEILLGLIGLPGIGWIYSGKGMPGTILLVCWIVWNCIAAAIILASSGIALLCTIPIGLVEVTVSALLLNNYASQHPEVFG